MPLLQAMLPEKDSEGLRETLEALQHQTSGNPVYAKYHAQYAGCLWEACQAARHALLSSAHVLKAAHLHHHDGIVGARAKISHLKAHLLQVASQDMW